MDDVRPRVTTPKFLAMGCIGAIASALPAHAQTATSAADDQPTLGGVTVTDTVITEGSYKTDRQDSPKATAPLLDTPRSITVIPQQVLKDTASATLAEALRTVPGITMGAGEGGNPLGDRPFIRGFDSQASTYLDGVRDIGAQTREVFDIESIEVTKGSDSVTGGGGNPGGSINLVSKQPTSERFIEANGSYGSADYKRATVDINQPINDFVGVRLNAMWHDQDVAGRDAVFQKRWGVAPSVKIGLTGPTSLTIGYYHLHTNELPDGGIPITYTLANQPTADSKARPLFHFTTIGGEEINIPRGAFYGLRDRDFRRTNVDDFTIRAQHAFDNGIVLRNTSRYSHTYQAYLWTLPDDSTGNVYGTNPASPVTAGGQVWRRINQRYGNTQSLINQTDLYGKVDTGGLQHSFAASAEYSHIQSAFGSYVANAATGQAIASGSTISPRCTPTMVDRYNCTTVDNPNPNDPWVPFASDTSSAPGTIEKSLPKTQTLSRATSYGVSLFDTITATDWLLFNLGGRYDHYETRVSPGLTATSTLDRSWLSKTDNLFTYQAGVILKPRPNGSIYFSTAKAATPPGQFLGQGSEDNNLTTANIDPRDLKVQKTTSYEVGTKWSLFDSNLLLSLALFQTKTTNARTANPDGTVSYVGTRRIRGVEFGYSGNITEAWSVYGGYTYMPSKILDAGVTRTVSAAFPLGVTAPAAATGHAFPNTPKHSFTAFTSYKVTPKLNVGGGAIYMSEVYGGYSDLRSLDAAGNLVISKRRATYVPSYWRFDANASYQLTDMIKLQVNANNLTNKRYFDQVYSTHYGHQAPGRTIIGSVAFRY